MTMTELRCAREVLTKHDSDGKLTENSTSHVDDGLLLGKGHDPICQNGKKHILEQVDAKSWQDLCSKEEADCLRQNWRRLTGGVQIIMCKYLNRLVPMTVPSSPCAASVWMQRARPQKPGDGALKRCAVETEWLRK